MNRQEYVEKVKQQLQEWEQDLDRLESKMETIQTDVRHKLDDRVNELKQKRAEVLEKAHQLEHAAEDAWGDLRDGIEMAWDSLKLGFMAARSEFEKQDDKKE